MQLILLILFRETMDYAAAAAAAAIVIIIIVTCKRSDVKNVLRGKAKHAPTLAMIKTRSKFVLREENCIYLAEYCELCYMHPNSRQDRLTYYSCPHLKLHMRTI